MCVIDTLFVRVRVKIDCFLMSHQHHAQSFSIVNICFHTIKNCYCICISFQIYFSDKCVSLSHFLWGQKSTLTVSPYWEIVIFSHIFDKELSSEVLSYDFHTFSWATSPDWLFLLTWNMYLCIICCFFCSVLTCPHHIKQ